MFFEGSLQDGISTALQQSRQVVCFVTDGESESQQWEEEFLQDESIRPGLESQSVILKLSAGSEEAGYLEALFPIPKKPTVVVIQNGQLKEYIAAGTNKEEFIRRLGGTSQQEASQGPPPPYSTAYTGLAAIPPQSPQATESQPSQGTDDLIDPTQPAVTATDSPASNQGNPQTEQPTEEEKRAAAAKKKGKARAEAEDEAQRRVNERCGCDPPNPEQAHANEIKLRKQQANEERKRILKRIEDDKKARKERDAAERRARALLSADPNADPDANAGSSTAHETPAVALRQRSGKQQKGNGGDYCNLQVRLLDGSTMRSRFPSDKTLSTDVRAWIDAERTDGNAAYGFRILLTPLPNKVVSPTEETKSLLKLGLAPSATLVLIPARYSLARGSYGDDLLSPVLAIFSSLYGAIMDSIGGIFGFLFGGGGGNAGRNRNDGGGSGSGDGDDVPMENLWARRRDAQLYNGNSLSFEPRNDEEDDDQNHRR